MYKFSIILPVRNGGEYVKTCVNSILSQTEQDFNLIVLDNCSTDGTREWLASLQNKKIIIYPADRPLTIEENWARAIDVPKNEFITLIGHDDILHPDYLSVINNLINQHPAAGLYQTHFNFIDEKGDIIRPCAGMQNTIKPEEFIQYTLLNKIEVTGTGFMIRSAEYDKIGGIPPYPNLLYADIEMVLQLIGNSYLAVAPDTTFEFRFHINNTSKSGGEKRLAAFERLIAYLKKVEIENEVYRDIIQKNVSTFLHSYVIGSCHKLIYIPEKKREGITMDRIIEVAKKAAQTLSPVISFFPEKNKSIVLAKLVDSNPVTRAFFLFYKSFKQRTF